MPRHEAPNHPDCNIDCADGGYANYIEPYGPCRTGCNSVGLSGTIFDAVQQYGWGIRLSGVVRDLPGRQLRELALRLRPLARENPSVIEVLVGLEQVADAIGDETIDAKWTDADSIDVLKNLRDAAAITQ